MEGRGIQLKGGLRFAVVTGVALAILVGWGLLLYFASTARLNLGLLLLANIVLFVDFFDFILRVYFIHRHTAPGSPWRTSLTSCPVGVEPADDAEVRKGLRPFAIVVSIYNLPAADLDWFLRCIEPYREHLWVIDDCSEDDTWERLQRSGVRAIRGEVNRNKPGAIRELLRTIPEEVGTVVVLDPDARILSEGGGSVTDLDRVLFDFQRSGMAAVCPRLTLRHRCYLEKLQAFEFCLSFALGRRSLGDHAITSGISIYRRDALAGVLEHHSLSIYAEDLKNAFLLLADGERIYYDSRLTIETAGKPTWGSWFSQRVGWYYGLLKVYGEHMADATHGVMIRDAGKRFSFLYQFVIYMGVLTLLFHPFKVLSVGFLLLSAATGLAAPLGLEGSLGFLWVDPLYALIAFGKYLLLALLAFLLVARPDERRRLLLVVPAYYLYTLVQIVPATVGFLNWFSLRLIGRRLYQDHFQAEESVRREFQGARTQ